MEANEDTLWNFFIGAAVWLAVAFAVILLLAEGSKYIEELAAIGKGV